MSGRVAGTFAGTVALFFAASAHAAVGADSGGAAHPSEAAMELPAPTAGKTGGAPYSKAPRRRSARPVLTVFSVTASALNAGRPVVRFRINDRSPRVRVGLAFASPDGRVYRKRLRWRRTGVTHSYTWRPPHDAAVGDYRVRIAARDLDGYRVARGTTVRVSPPTVSSEHRFPVAGPYTFGGSEARFGAKRTGHIHQGQDIMAASGTPVVAPHGGRVTWVAYQAAGAGYYVVLASDGEPYYYVFMHLLKGSTAVKAGDRVATGQQLGAVGATGRADGAHLHFEIWDGPWYNGGHAVDPLPFLKQWPGA